MSRCVWRVRFGLLSLVAGVLPVLNGCWLSDQQLAAVWQSVLTSGINTVVTNIIAGAAPA